MVGNLVVRHTDDVAEVAADAYSFMEGASSLIAACRRFTVPITTGYIEHLWEQAPVRIDAAREAELREIWLHVPDRDTKEVAVATERPPEPAELTEPEPEPKPQNKIAARRVTGPPPGWGD
jgi:hypothetical protein